MTTTTLNTRQPIGGFVIEDKFGHLIALDKASGGYPYAAHTIREVEFWKSFESAHSYWTVFENGRATDDGWKIKEATLTVKGITGT